MLMTDTYIGQCLDFPINLQDTPCHVKVLMQLSRASGLYLECPSLKGIEIEEIPVAHGGYGDVYKGLLHGKEITVKALRVYRTSDMVKLLKVGIKLNTDLSRLNRIIRNFCTRLSCGNSFLTLMYCPSMAYIIHMEHYLCCA